MKYTFLSFLLVCLLAWDGCKKDDDGIDTPIVTSEEVLKDFANVIANPNYTDINNRAAALNEAVQALNGVTTDENLAAARDAWRDTRASWEQCEAFLFGPAEDFNYDPTMDDWPVNKVDLDSLLNSSNALTLNDIDALPTSLKGFHPIEYMLFGVGGSKTAVDFTDREKLYLASLTQSLYNTTLALKNSWDVTLSGNFTNELITAGNGSQRYASRQDALIAIVTAMAGICEEVANGKMEEPLAAQDSTLEESQFSHNSTTDFKNNITGVLNGYLGKYTTDGHGLNELVAGKNLSLDNTLENQINAAISSFDAIDLNYGHAIYTQQVQIHNAQEAINALKQTLENDLITFIKTNVKD
jgi:putative iron-regulated protein